MLFVAAAAATVAVGIPFVIYSAAAVGIIFVFLFS